MFPSLIRALYVKNTNYKFLDFVCYNNNSAVIN